MIRPVMVPFVGCVVPFVGCVVALADFVVAGCPEAGWEMSPRRLQPGFGPWGPGPGVPGATPGEAQNHPGGDPGPGLGTAPEEDREAMLYSIQELERRAADAMPAGADPVRADNDGDTPMDALGLEPHELAELTSDPVTFAVLDRLQLGERYDPGEEDAGAEKEEADREDGRLARLMAI